jgi:signal transduction histidine kinase
LEAIEKSFLEHIPFNINFRLVTPQGETRWITTSASLTYDVKGQPIRMLGATSDITEQKELEQRKDDFIGMASHELKTPLTTLKGLTQLLIRRIETQELSESVLALSKMESQINRLTRLIKDLLDVTKIQARRLDYVEERIAFDTFLSDIVKSVQQFTRTHTICVEGAANTSIIGDSDRLEQVFINLINNAIKYSPHADEVDIQVSATEDRVIVSVQDYGVGIPKEEQSKIFDRFYRVSSKATKEFRGLGMGLYISREIVKYHGGTLTVESCEGKRSTFVVSLPIVGPSSNCILGRAR